MSDIDSFRQAVETFISSRGWTATRFGRAIAGDPLFVFDLREGARAAQRHARPNPQGHAG